METHRVKVITDDGTTKHIAKLHKAVVRKEGKRAVDSADFEVSIKTPAETGYIVSYIQDVADTTYLTSVYNFQGTDRDEGGFDLDGDGTHNAYQKPYGASSNTEYNIGGVVGNDGRFLSNYCAEFDGTNTAGRDKITVSNNADHHDFSGQFDIYAWAENKNDGSDGDIRIIFSKIDTGGSGSGVELGIKKVSGSWLVYGRVRISGTDHTYVGGAFHSNFRLTTKPVLLRMRRDSSDEIRVTINEATDNGVWDGGSNEAYSTSADLSNTSSLFIGSDGSTNRWKGIAHQLRLYCGGFLPDSESHHIMTDSPQCMTMKFRGTAYKVIDRTNMKEVRCVGQGKLLYQTVFTGKNTAEGSNTTMWSSTSSDGDDYGNDTNGDALVVRPDNNNIYDRSSVANNTAYNTEHKHVIQSLALHAEEDISSPKWKVIHNQLSSNNSQNGSGGFLFGSWVAGGTFLQQVRLLCASNNMNIWANARKTFFLEKNTGITTPYKFTQDGSNQESVNISESGDSDMLRVNDIEVIGGGRPLTKQETKNTTNNSNITTLSQYPIVLQQIEVINNLSNGNFSNGDILTEGTDFDVAYDSKKITFKGDAISAVMSVRITYQYEDPDNIKRWSTASAPNRVTDVGRFSARLYVTQMTAGNDLSTLAQKIVNTSTGLQELRKRYTIKVPYLLNNLRENHEIGIKNIVKGIGNSTTYVDTIVRQIEWRYPECRTIIHAGEISYDGLDLMTLEAETSGNLTSGTFKTKAV